MRGPHVRFCERCGGAIRRTYSTVARSLAAHQLQVLLAAGDPTATQAAPAWRPVVVLS